MARGFSRGASIVGAPREDLKSDRVAADIEQRILSGSLVPGERLPTEGELCDLLGVSRSVIRDAMRTLAARGLITVRQGHGTAVAEPDDEAFSHALLALLARSELTMGEVLEAREALETGLIPEIVENGVEEDWDRLDDSLEKLTAAVEAAEWDDAHEYHLDFHLGLLMATHSPALEMFLRPLHEVILVSSVPPRLSVSEDWEVESHRPIVAALRAGDVEAAKEAMREHFAVVLTDERSQKFRQQFFRSAVRSTTWPRRPTP